uniref:Uncharacterized protein n=1 Tax=Seriola lalandi dorsalis TaxID=1841481 RepID=A0A3B4XUJ0_SERLL
MFIRTLQITPVLCIGTDVEKRFILSGRQPRTAALFILCYGDGGIGSPDHHFDDMQRRGERLCTAYICCHWRFPSCSDQQVEHIFCVRKVIDVQYVCAESCIQSVIKFCLMLFIFPLILHLCNMFIKVIHQLHSFGFPLYRQKKNHCSFLYYKYLHSETPS